MKALNKESVNLLSSGQVITSVVDAVKELVENALDSGAKTIKIKLEDQGLKAIIITDDGSGIAKQGRETCCLAHTTSKIASIDDLRNELSTFGFRGEALHALCCLSDVVITTRCHEEPTAQKLAFDKNGNPIKIDTVTAPYGTSVMVSNILSVFPVRVREERTNFNVENIKSLLSKYYLAAPTVRFIVDVSPHFNQTRPPLTSLMQAVSFEFGTNVAANLIEKNAEGYSGDIRIRFKGLVPSPTCDWKVSSTSRLQTKQLILVNGRPVKNHSIEKQINESCWKRFGSIPKRFPRFIICIDFYRDNQISSSMVDVNLDSNKGHVIFSEQGTITKLIDSIMAFEQKTVKFKRITSWPSESIEISHPEIDISNLGSCKWTDAGTFDDYSLFSVKDHDDNTQLIAVDTRGLFELCDIPRTEIGRTAQSELITLYWDQILELHSNEKNRIYHIMQI